MLVVSAIVSLGLSERLLFQKLMAEMIGITSGGGGSGSSGLLDDDNNDDGGGVKRP